MKKKWQAKQYTASNRMPESIARWLRSISQFTNLHTHNTTSVALYASVWWSTTNTWSRFNVKYSNWLFRLFYRARTWTNYRASCFMYIQTLWRETEKKPFFHLQPIKRMKWNEFFPFYSLLFWPPKAKLMPFRCYYFTIEFGWVCSILGEIRGVLKTN